MAFYLSLSHLAVILGEEVHSGSTDRAKPGQERSPDGYGFPLVSSHLHILACSHCFSISQLIILVSQILTRGCSCRNTTDQSVIHVCCSFHLILHRLCESLALSSLYKTV